MVTREFRRMGHEAWSCDILPSECEWHIQCDVSTILDGWDLVIAFPPCTHLALSGAAWWASKKEEQAKAIEFFMMFTRLERYAIENPVGIMSSFYRKPDQIIRPNEFGATYSKRTCLWLKGLPRLTPTDVRRVEPSIRYESGRVSSKWHHDTYRLPKEIRARVRSRTPEGLAKAMAEQWSNYVS